MPHEFEGVKEPTREGWWWPEGKDEPYWCHQLGSCDAWVCSPRRTGEEFACRALADSWTGPIPEPKPKAPSEDEGEKWGRRLYKLWPEERELSWAELSSYAKHCHKQAALRFLAACIAPLEDAIRGYFEAFDGSDYSLIEERRARLRSTLSALPSPQPEREAAEDKDDIAYIQKLEASGTANFRPLEDVEKDLDSPRPSEEDCTPRLEIDDTGSLVPRGSAPSDEDLGRSVADWLRDELRIKALDDVCPAELRALGAAIREKAEGK